jgi:cardiolipin synthase
LPEFDVGWNSETVCLSPNQWFSEIENAIREARHSVLLETYIFDDDAVGKRILEALEEASRRGVSVRLLVDGLGAANWLHSLGIRIFHFGFEIRVFHPLPSRVMSWSSGPWDPLSRALQMLIRLNKRDHKKIVVVDGSRAWIGSWNISSSHFGDGKTSEWRDAGCVLLGDSVREVVAVFEHSWMQAFSPTRPRLFGVIRRINSVILRPRMLPWRSVLFTDFLRMRKHFRREVCSRVAQSHTRVWLATAYFVPVPRLVRSLLKAARRGADVRVLVPANSDVPVVPWVSRFFYRELMDGGVRVFEYQPSMMHAKVLVADEWVFVGSANMNFRSFHRDSEIGVVLSQRKAREGLEEQFLRDLEMSREVCCDPMEKVPFWQQVLGFVLFRFRFWMSIL